MIGTSLLLLLLLAAPALLVLAYREWTRRLRRDLSGWRSNVGLLSLVALLLSWISFVTPIVLLGAFKIQRMPEILPALQVLLAISGTLSALALKGVSRIESLGAGLCLIFLFFTVLNT